MSPNFGVWESPFWTATIQRALTLRTMDQSTAYSHPAIDLLSSRMLAAKLSVEQEMNTTLGQSPELPSQHGSSLCLGFSYSYRMRATRSGARSGR